MKVDFNSQTIKELPKKAIKSLNNLGESASLLVKEKYDSFTKTNAGEYLKEHNVNKNTFIGAAILVTATTLAVKCLASLKNKIREIKE